MDPKSRNRVLMIGGALIVIALLLVCGPLEGQFGRGQRDIEAVDTTPDVAAAPPEVSAPTIDPALAAEAAKAATTGALTGAAIGESDLTNALDGESTEPLPIVPAPQPVTAAPAPVKVSKAAPPKAVAPPVATSAEPPPVSAGGPVAAAPIVALKPTAEDRAATAADDFDSSIADLTNALDRDGGKAVDRFAPPVDSGPRVALAPAGLNTFALRPCDTPGSGCQNIKPRQRARPTPAAGGGSLVPTP